jgi:hypothetical protein
MTIDEVLQPAFSELFDEPRPRTFEVHSGIRILLYASMHAKNPEFKVNCKSVREYLGTEIAFPQREEGRY